MEIEEQMNKLYKVKDEQQRKALNNWWKAGAKGSIIAGTGFGKSRCGVLAMKHVLKEGGRGLLLVPTTQLQDCLLYTSPSPRDATLSRMPSSA